MHEHSKKMTQLAVDALEDIKALDIVVLDVTGMSSVTDVMIVSSGRSSRQVKAIVDNLVAESKQAGFPPLGVEGEREGEWGLVDLGDVIVHVMQPEIRDFYQLEKLWLVGGRDPGNDAEEIDAKA